jgi:hypothetical protein
MQLLLIMIVAGKMHFISVDRTLRRVIAINIRPIVGVEETAPCVVAALSRAIAVAAPYDRRRQNAFFRRSDLAAGHCDQHQQNHLKHHHGLQQQMHRHHHRLIPSPIIIGTFAYTAAQPRC